MTMRRIDYPMVMAATALLLLLLGLDFYPPGLANVRRQEMCLAVVLAVIAHVVANVIAVRWFRDVDRDLRRAVLGSGLLFAFFTVTYVTLVATLTEVPDGSSKRLPVGLIYSTNFLAILPTNNDDVVVTKQEFKYDLDRIYRPWSLVMSMTLLIGNWVLLFATGSFFYTELQRLRQLAGPRRRDHSSARGRRCCRQEHDARTT